MIAINKNGFLYNFLTDSRFRIWKHILLVLSMAIISSNQVVMAYQDCLGVLGNLVYWLCLSMLVVYLTLAYLNIYLLVPQLLLKKRYGIYILTLTALVAILPLLSMLVQEYLVRTVLHLPHRLDSYTNPLLLMSSLSILIIMTICFSGTSISIFFRHWIIESKLVNELEKEHIQTEVDQLKEQITPGFLSNILSRTSVLVKTEPSKASDMLMRLGQLLRYQLYDCSREKVLLSSEVIFLTNYLNLEQLHSNKFGYKIQTDDINRLFVSPLLFIPFIQGAVGAINKQDKYIFMQIDFVAEEEKLTFSCTLDSQEVTIADDFLSIRKRLNLLYSNSYSLSVTNSIVKLQLSLTNS